MNLINLKTIIFGIFIFSLFCFTDTVYSATFGAPPPSVDFNPITLNGGIQEMSGGSGNIEVNGQLLGGLLYDEWDLTVVANQFQNTNNSSLKLPLGSLQLTKPNSGTGLSCTTLQLNGPRVIDNGGDSVLFIRARCGTLLGIIGSCSFSFSQPLFTLTIDPSVKMIDPGKENATYTTTITWTLTSTGIL